MSKCDYVLLAPIFLGVVYGFYRGFFKELVVLVCVIVALFVSRYFGQFVALSLNKILGLSPQVTKPLSFVIIFIASVIGLKILAELLTKLSKVASFSLFNRFLGALLGGTKWLIITSVCLNLFSFYKERIDINRQNNIVKSKLYVTIEEAVIKIIPLLNFNRFLGKKEDKNK